MCIAASLEKEADYRVQILDTQVEQLSYENIRKEIEKRNPDVIGMTAITFTMMDVIKVAKIAKEVNPNIQIVLRGPHVIIYPEETINFPEVDFLVLSEEEKVFKLLLDNINKPEELKKIKGLVFFHNNKIVNIGRTDFIENLDELPFPARHLIPYKKYFAMLSQQGPVTTNVH